MVLVRETIKGIFFFFFFVLFFRKISFQRQNCSHSESASDFDQTWYKVFSYRRIRTSHVYPDGINIQRWETLASIKMIELSEKYGIYDIYI